MHKPTATVVVNTQKYPGMPHISDRVNLIPEKNLAAVGCKINHKLSKIAENDLNSVLVNVKIFHTIDFIN
jgi:hypothetical protein